MPLLFSLLSLTIGINNIRNSACRPATLFNFTCHQLNSDCSKTKPFAVQGSSGGACAIANTMTWYGGNSWIDFASMLNCPNFSNVITECIYPAGPNITVCPNNGQTYCNQTSERFSTNTSGAWTFGDCSSILQGIVGYPCACSSTTYNSTILSWFDSESVLGTGSQLSFNKTGMSSWLCKPPDNISVGMDQFFAQSVTATNGFHQWLINSCPGTEAIFTGTYSPTGQSGLTVITNDMLHNFVPRH